MKEKLFRDQPAMTKQTIADLHELGAVSYFGDSPIVVSYMRIDALIQEGLISDEDAKRLLVIEAHRPRENGSPRATIISRMMKLAIDPYRKRAMTMIDSIAANR